MENEVAEWSLKRNLLTFLHITEEVRHKSILHAVQTKCEAIGVDGRRADGIGASNFFSVWFRLPEREPLSRDKAKALYSEHIEFKVFSELR